MNSENHNTERNRPGVVLGLRAAALAGLIVVAGVPLAGPAGAVGEPISGVVTELDLAGHHGSTCCPSIGGEIVS
jgi:hypothetical protein